MKGGDTHNITLFMLVWTYLIPSYSLGEMALAQGTCHNHSSLGVVLLPLGGKGLMGGCGYHSKKGATVYE